MNPDNTQKIQELETKNQELTKKLDDLSGKFEEFKGVLTTHTHGGLDGSKQFYNDPIVLKSGIGISSGKYQFIDAEDLVNNRLVGGLVVGEGAKGSGTTDIGIHTSQILIEHQTATDGTINNTFYYGDRSPMYLNISNINVSSGGTTMSQSKFNWTTDELAGAYVIIYNSATPARHQFTRQIASNTSSTITIDGTFPATVNGSCDIIMPIYLGHSTHPWRTGYFVGDDISSGGTGAQRKVLRFGMGLSSGADVISIYFGTGSPEAVVTANIGSLYLRTDGGANTTLYIKESGISNTGWIAK